MLLNIFSDLFQLLLHFDLENLSLFVANYQTVIYVILFSIIFVETGLVIMPFLPGDSLLFATGMLAAQDNSSLSVTILIPLLILAAVSGDTTNYFIGNKIGTRLFDMNIRFMKREYLTRTQDFFEKHGGKTIIIARYMPIIRTFTPFVAGVGSMKFPRFILFCVVGGALWVSLFTLVGYWFGQNEWVQHNFKYVILGIMMTSFLPFIWRFIQNKFLNKTAQ